MEQREQAQVTRIPIDDVPLDHWDDPIRGRLSWRTLISSDRTPSNTLACGLAYFGADGEERQHRHAPAQLLHVIEGDGRAVLDSEEHPLRPGDTLFIPGDTLHSFHASERGMTILFLFGVDSLGEVEYVFPDEAPDARTRRDRRRDGSVARPGAGVSSRPVRVPIDDVPLEHWDDPVHGYVSWRTLISADRLSSDSVVCGMAYFDTGGELKAHRHAPPEVFHVLAGAGTAVIEGVNHPMAAGDTLFVPGHSVHSFHAKQDGMQMLFFFGVDSFDDVEYIFEQAS